MSKINRIADLIKGEHQIDYGALVDEYARRYGPGTHRLQLSNDIIPLLVKQGRAIRVARGVVGDPALWERSPTADEVKSARAGVAPANRLAAQARQVNIRAEFDRRIYGLMAEGRTIAELRDAYQRAYGMAVTRNRVNAALTRLRRIGAVRFELRWYPVKTAPTISATQNPGARP